MGLLRKCDGNRSKELLTGFLLSFRRSSVGMQTGFLHDGWQAFPSRCKRETMEQAKAFSSSFWSANKMEGFTFSPRSDRFPVFLCGKNAATVFHRGRGKGPEIMNHHLFYRLIPAGTACFLAVSQAIQTCTHSPTVQFTMKSMKDMKRSEEKIKQVIQRTRSQVSKVFRQFKLFVSFTWRFYIRNSSCPSRPSW